MDIRDKTHVAIKVEGSEPDRKLPQHSQRHLSTRKAKSDCSIKILKLGRGMGPIYYDTEDEEAEEQYIKQDEKRERLCEDWQDNESDEWSYPKNKTRQNGYPMNSSSSGCSDRREDVFITDDDGGSTYEDDNATATQLPKPVVSAPQSLAPSIDVHQATNSSRTKQKTQLPKRNVIQRPVQPISANDLEWSVLREIDNARRAHKVRRNDPPPLTPDDVGWTQLCCCIPATANGGQGRECIRCRVNESPAPISDLDTKFTGADLSIFQNISREWRKTYSPGLYS